MRDETKQCNTLTQKRAPHWWKGRKHWNEIYLLRIKLIDSFILSNFKFTYDPRVPAVSDRPVPNLRWGGEGSLLVSLAFFLHRFILFLCLLCLCIVPHAFRYGRLLFCRPRSAFVRYANDSFTFIPFWTVSRFLCSMPSEPAQPVITFLGFCDRHCRLDPGVIEYL